VCVPDKGIDQVAWQVSAGVLAARRVSVARAKSARRICLCVRHPDEWPISTSLGGLWKFLRNGAIELRSKGSALDTLAKGGTITNYLFGVRGMNARRYHLPQKDATCDYISTIGRRQILLMT